MKPYRSYHESRAKNFTSKTRAEGVSSSKTVKIAMEQFPDVFANLGDTAGHQLESLTVQ